MRLICKKPFVKVVSGVSPGAILSHGKEGVIMFGCGQCLFCRINRARVWSHRLMLEQKNWKESIFVTLTYDDANLPAAGSLIPKHLTLFLKRVRRNYDLPFRYYAVGEYGDLHGRPHFHLVMFGIGKCIELIQKAWSCKTCGKPFGLVHIGEVNNQSTRYITGYIVKKLKKGNEKLGTREPEFCRMSRGGAVKGGIGAPSIDRIGKNLMKNKYWKPRVVNSLKYGKRSLPLGRYLTERLNRIQGLSEEYVELSNFHMNLDKQLNIMRDNKFYINFIDDNAAKRKAIQKRYRIFKQRRTF